jgi:two-component system, NtrC family, response regulator HydG
MRACLTIERGEGVPRTVDLHPELPVTLGRSRNNTVVLHDEHASRHHAKVFFHEGQWHVQDFGALNGTRIDGERIQDQAELRHGQEIGIADMRLRFALLDPGSAEPRAPVPAATTARLEHNGKPDDEETSLQPDEVAVLLAFMTACMNETDPQAVVRRLLEVVHKQTAAAIAGFLSFDPENPLSKLVLPELAHVDIALSRQLNQRAREENRTVWLREGTGGLESSGSLLPFNDAVCVPLPAEGPPLGALHVYKSEGQFTPGAVRFCEAASTCAAGSLARLRILRRLAADNSRLRGHVPESDRLVGESSAMRRLQELIIRAASCSATVLIHGETGAGKEPVAVTLHAQSPRAGGPFVVCNCGAIAPSLLESELFGHVRGAFTGATHDRAGVFEQADDGTLFLDEIADMSVDCQVKVLRVIEGKGFRPVGGTREVLTDVRIVAATHKDLEREVRAGRFRQDLYYRLRVVFIRVPPLREHAEDIPALAQFFLERLAEGKAQKKKRLSHTALRRLQEYTWPGNVRQLRATLENAVIMSARDTIEEQDLWLADTAQAELPLSLNLEELTTWAIRRALDTTNGNITRAAELLGVARETLRIMMKKYEIARGGK